MANLVWKTNKNYKTLQMVHCVTACTSGLACGPDLWAKAENGYITK